MNYIFVKKVMISLGSTSIAYPGSKLAHIDDRQCYGIGLLAISILIGLAYGGAAIIASIYPCTLRSVALGSLVAVTSLLGAGFFLLHRTVYVEVVSGRKWAFWLFASTLLLGLSYFYFTASLPRFGWDALDPQWIGRTVDIIVAYHSGSCEGSLFDELRHSRLMPSIHALEYFQRHSGPEFVILNPYWLVLIASLFFMLMGWVLSVGLSVWWAFSVSYLLISVPIIENHVLVSGYADLPLTIYSVQLLSCFALSLISRRHWFLMFVIPLATLVALVKNIGLLHLIAISLSVVSFLLWRWRAAFVVMVLALGAFTAAVYNFGIDFTLAGNTYRLVPGDPAYVTISTYLYLTEQYPAIEVIKNSIHAFVMNGSFVLTAFIFALYLGFGASRNAFDQKELVLYCSYFLTFILALSGLQLIFEKYALIYAAAGNDIGNSRFLMVLSFTVLFCLPPLVKCAQSYSKH